MARSNRALRRSMAHRPRAVETRALQVAHLERRVRTLPGLPGGPGYVPEETQFEAMAAVIDGLLEITPGMSWRVEWWRRIMRCDPPRLRRLRRVREVVPGVGEGVLLGEFTDVPVQRRGLVLPEVLVKHRSVGLSTSLWKPGT